MFLNVSPPERARWWKIPLKRCPYCKKLFKPNPRTAYEQRSCAAAECRKKRKRAAQKKWHKKNPTYFHGRYPQVKEWLDDHPGYLNEYRQKNRARTSAKRETKRKTDSIPEVRAGLEARIVVIEEFFRKLPWDDIQDTLKARNPDGMPFYTQFTHG